MVELVALLIGLIGLVRTIAFGWGFLMRVLLEW